MRQKYGGINLTSYDTTSKAFMEWLGHGYV